MTDRELENIKSPIELARLMKSEKDMWTGATAGERRLEDMVIKALETLDQLESGELARVVRCKDCKHFTRKRYAYETEEHTRCGRDYEMNTREPDDFCSYGKPKE